MSYQDFEFYLFNIGHGQSAAVRCPNGECCLFDFGKSDTFSPVDFVINNLSSPHTARPIYQATISHFHEDHISDAEQLLKAGPAVIRYPRTNEQYLQLFKRDSLKRGVGYDSYILGNIFPHTPFVSSLFYPPKMGGVRIDNKLIPPDEVKSIPSGNGGKINNTSIVSRVEYAGTAILICGDMEASGWNYALNHLPDAPAWRRHVSDVDVLVAPHHGHSSGYSQQLMDLAKPSVVLISATSKDESIDDRYSNVPGVSVGESGTYKRITTRDQNRHIHFSVDRNGLRSWHELKRSRVSDGRGPVGLVRNPFMLSR